MSTEKIGKIINFTSNIKKHIFLVIIKWNKHFYKIAPPPKGVFLFNKKFTHGQKQLLSCELKSW